MLLILTSSAGFWVHNASSETQYAAALAKQTIRPINPVERIANYTIDVVLDAEAKTISAEQIITYTNTTSEPIPNLVFHLYLNAFRDENSYFLSDTVAHRGFGWSPDGAGHITVTSLRLQDGTELDLKNIEDDTLATADLPLPLAEGQSLTLYLTYTAQLPRLFARTGFAQDFFLVGQWFPKLGVWQDGAWNAYPFYANNEFYADFGTYDVTITVPDNLVVGATGLPTGEQNNGDGTRTVNYFADPVIDFAWTASSRFSAETRQFGDVEVVYMVLDEHHATTERVMYIAEKSLETFGDWFGPYPYKRLTIVDVPADGAAAGGMEYPTFVTAGTLDVGADFFTNLRGIRALETVVAHEIGHQWFQSMVATNEAEEPWLDEGFTDYATGLAMDAAFGTTSSVVDLAGVQMNTADLRRMEYLLEAQTPMFGKAHELEAYTVATYSKPTLSMATLERVVGRDTMKQIMRTYFERFSFAHPTTDDFQTVAEEVSAENLDWFFDGLVYGGDVANYLVQSIDETSVTVARQGNLVLPAEVLITFEDGSTVLELWDTNERSKTFTYSGTPSIQSAELDPEQKLLVDLRYSDNGLSVQPDNASLTKILLRFLYDIQDLLLLAGGL